MTVYLRNPMSIIASQAGSTDPTVKITGYDSSTGTIKGVNFGITAGTVYLLNRNTHSYSALTTSAWGDDEIVLTTPIDTSTIEGTTCFFIRTAKGANSNKYLIEGDIAVTGWGLVYVQDPLTGNVSKLQMLISGEMDCLVGTAPSLSSGYVNSTFYGKYVSLDSLTFHTSQIVGVQFGSAVSGYTIPAYFLMGLTNLDQPVVIKSGMTINNSSTYFMFNCRSFNCPLVFTGSTSSQIRCGNYFLSKCVSFNQPLDLSRFTYLTSTYFMSNCWNFNSELKLATTLASGSSNSVIGANFMERCTSFNQPLTLPTNMSGVGNYFMYMCSGFNQPLNFTSSMSGSGKIGTYFLGYCYAYNQPIDFSATGITNIGNYFLYCGKAFNSPIKFPTTLTSIGTYFLASTIGSSNTATTNLTYGGSFNQPLDLSKVTSINNYFLYNQTAFNSPIDISKIETIGTYFMHGCTVFAQHITIPSTATSIGASFMCNIIAYRKMTVNTSTVPATTALTITTNSTTQSSYAPTQMASDVPAISKGIYLYGTQRTAWLSGLPNSSSSPYRNLIDGAS